VRAHHAGQADLTTFAAIVKREMRDLPPTFRFAWTALHDPSTRISSIAEIIVDAHDRATRGTATYMAAAKARSVIANVAAQNGQLAVLGHPALAATVSPGRKTASVKVKGKMLERDFPLIARDWDPAANSRLLATVAAGAGFDAHWKCHRCAYEWVAQVAQRRQVRLPRLDAQPCARLGEVPQRGVDGRQGLRVFQPGVVEHGLLVLVAGDDMGRVVISRFGVHLHPPVARRAGFVHEQDRDGVPHRVGKAALRLGADELGRLIVDDQR